MIAPIIIIGRVRGGGGPIGRPASGGGGAVEAPLFDGGAAHPPPGNRLLSGGPRHEVPDSKGYEIAEPVVSE